MKMKIVAYLLIIVCFWNRRGFAAQQSSDTLSVSSVDVYMSEKELLSKNPHYTRVSITWLKMGDKLFAYLSTEDGSIAWVDAAAIYSLKEAKGISKTLNSK